MLIFQDINKFCSIFILSPNVNIDFCQYPSYMYLLHIAIISLRMNWRNNEPSDIFRWKNNFFNKFCKNIFQFTCKSSITKQNSSEERENCDGKYHRFYSRLIWIINASKDARKKRKNIFIKIIVTYHIFESPHRVTFRRHRYPNRLRDRFAFIKEIDSAYTRQTV